MRVMSSAADIAHIEDCLDWLPLMSPDDATSKLIYLAIRSFESKGRCVREWVAARNQFAILYSELENFDFKTQPTRGVLRNQLIREPHDKTLSYH